MLLLSFTALLIALLFPHALLADNSPVKIVTLGDSITKGARPGVKREETFAHLLQKRLQKEKIEAEVVNVGIGGENTRQALARLGKILALKPRLVTIMYGTNDSYIDKGKKESRLTPEEYDANLRKMVADLRAAGIQPVLMTPPIMGDKHAPDGAGQHPNVRLTIYAKVCRKVAEDTKTPLVDHYAVWEKTNAAGTNISDWTTDHCHPNPRGHQEITTTMLPVVLKVLREGKNN